MMEITSREFELEIGALIKEEREKCGFSQYTLAKESELSVYQIREIEEGKGITVSQLDKISKALALSTDFFLEKEYREDCLKMQVRWHRSPNDT